MGQETTYSDFVTLHVSCPRARFAGYSYQIRIRFTGFTVHSLIFTDYSPILAGFALNDIRWLVVQLFQPLDPGGFLLLPLESIGDCDTSRTPQTPPASLAIIGNWQSKYIHYSDWSQV
jgi:hypothetical protein